MALAGLRAQLPAAGVVLLLGLSCAARGGAVGDRVEIGRTGDDVVVDVYHSKGIGGTLLPAADIASTARVIVRLHGFTRLESFVAASNTATLECALQRREGETAVEVCRLGSASFDALQRGADYFEVRLPGVLALHGEAIEIRWVDQWR